MSAILKTILAELEELKEVRGREVPWLHNKETWLASVDALLPSVSVFRPRKAFPSALYPQLADISLSDLSRQVLDCFDFPWKRTSTSHSFAGPLFITDIPERDEFRTAAQTLLMKLANQLPVLQEQQGFLVAGPVGCGKTTLTHLLALSATAMYPNSILINVECQGDTSAVFFSNIIAAGLLKSGLLTKDEVATTMWSIHKIRELVEQKFHHSLDVLLFVDEAQRMFEAKNAPIQTPLGGTTRAQVLLGEARTLESSWPRTFISGSASSLVNLFFRADLVPSTVFPSRMGRPLNDSKLKSATLRRIQTTKSVIVALADLERELQMAARVSEGLAELERDPETSLPMEVSDKNRAWIQARVQELSGDTWVHATKYARRFFDRDIKDERLVFFLALLFSRGVPRALKDLRDSSSTKITSLESFVPEAVRSLWFQMAKYLLLEKKGADLNRVLRDLGDVEFRTQNIADVLPDEDLAVLSIHIPTLIATVPEAAKVLADATTLTNWVDRGYVLWNESHKLLSFASVADFAITRLLAATEVRHFELLALLFNKLGEEHERIAVGALELAARTRFDEPDVRGVLSRIGLDTTDEEREFLTLRSLVRDRLVPFPTADELRILLGRSSTGPQADEVDTESGGGGDDDPDSAATAHEIGSGDIPPRSRTVDLLVSEAARQCRSLMTTAFPPKSRKTKTIPGIPFLTSVREEFVSLESDSLLLRFASLRREPASRNVHEAFDLEPGLRSEPVLFKPAPDFFKANWILVNPDQSLSVIQMKHGGSPIDERNSVVEITAGAKVLRSWLGHRGVPNWATVPIRSVVWCLRPTVESTWVAKEPVPTGAIAKAVGVEWLNKHDVAPIWSAEAVHILFHNNKHELWGVEGQLDRARVRRPSDRDLVGALSDLARRAEFDPSELAYGRPSVPPPVASIALSDEPER